MGRIRSACTVHRILPNNDGNDSLLLVRIKLNTRYGAFINRDLENNFAAKMYQLDYEHRRNRLTHNMIMEHFEQHTEICEDILDDVKNRGY